MLRKSYILSMVDEALDLMGPEFEVFLPVYAMSPEEVATLLDVIYAEILDDGPIQ